ncbi:hypothetical protein KIPB_009118 [Kipferlia bialata]|uniref:Uncharacterized protein n=1 Tax=Kipferlia bialata TaxID=797122 RepID=A0A9K3D1U0_9EUKA|nr:hypothetical protein KIPB_009118 [Kipferlia bialata]|eukprot:g9118.t1
MGFLSHATDTALLALLWYPFTGFHTLFPIAALSNSEVLCAPRGSNNVAMCITVPSEAEPARDMSICRWMSRSALSAEVCGLDNTSYRQRACVIGTRLYYVAECRLTKRPTFLEIFMDTGNWRVIPWENVGVPVPNTYSVACVAVEESILCIWGLKNSATPPNKGDKLVVMSYTPETRKWVRLSTCMDSYKAARLTSEPMAVVVRDHVHMVMAMGMRWLHLILTPPRGGSGVGQWKWEIGFIPSEVTSGIEGEMGIRAISTMGGKLLTQSQSYNEYHAYTPETGKWAPWTTSDPSTFPGVCVSPTTSVQVTKSSADGNDFLTVARIDPSTIYPHPDLEWATVGEGYGPGR